MSRLEDKLQENKLKAADGLKKYIFDWIAVLIIVALIAASLDIFGLIDFKTINIVEFFVSWFPYFAAAILLQTDLYKKGLFIGKSTTKFNNVIESYSSIANSLTGKQIEGLYSFCDKYNDDALKSIQTQILRKEGITLDAFDNERVKVINNENQRLKPLKICTNKELIDEGYTREQRRCIRAAKRVKVKGIGVNILLSSIAVKDVTSIGDDEKTMETKQIIFSAFNYMISTLLLSIVGIKDIQNFGWIAIVLVVFKVTYLFAGCYRSYFKGYDDITIRLANHFTRKADILKMYLSYDEELNAQLAQKVAKSV